MAVSRETRYAGLKPSRINGRRSTSGVTGSEQHGGGQMAQDKTQRNTGSQGAPEEEKVCGTRQSQLERRELWEEEEVSAMFHAAKQDKSGKKTSPDPVMQPEKQGNLIAPALSLPGPTHSKGAQNHISSFP